MQLLDLDLFSRPLIDNSNLNDIPIVIKLIFHTPETVLR